MGFIFDGEEEVVIECIENLEVRDQRVFNDENN